MRPPCEIVVKKVLPTIRSIITRDLIQKYGMSQNEVSEKLGVTQPAICHYMSGKHAFWTEIAKKEEVLNLIHEIEENIMSEKFDPMISLSKICEVCEIIRSSEEFCKIHAEICVQRCNTCNFHSILSKVD
ncbi:MAG: transcriptional regulator [Candidatus Hydrothermarchaeota archaeon]